MGGMKEVTASGRVVEMDPQAQELIKIARAFESGGGMAARQDAAAVRALQGAQAGGAGGGFQSSVLQNILQKGAGKDSAQSRGAGAAASAAVKAPASTAPKGFAGGGALGALLAKSGAKAGQAPAAPPVVMWGRPGAGERTSGAEPAPPMLAAGSGSGGASGVVAGGASGGHGGQSERGGGAHGIKAHAHASDLLGAMHPHAPASDLLGSRLSPPGAGGQQSAGKGSSVLANLLQGRAGKGALGAEGDSPGDGAERPIKDSHAATPPAAPLSVADASVITKFSETPGWGAYAPNDKKAVVERRKAVVQQHAGMFTLMGDLLFGGSVGRGLSGSVGAGEDGADSDSDQDTQKESKSPKRRVVPPSPASSAHLRELLANTTPEQSPAPVTAAEDAKKAGPLTMMGARRGKVGYSWSLNVRLRY